MRRKSFLAPSASGVTAAPCAVVTELKAATDATAATETTAGIDARPSRAALRMRSL